jgi:hypothetical protein
VKIKAILRDALEIVSNPETFLNVAERGEARNKFLKLNPNSYHVPPIHALDAEGHIVTPTDDNAVKWTLLGALTRSEDGHRRAGVPNWKQLEKFLCEFETTYGICSIACWGYAQIVPYDIQATQKFAVVYCREALKFPIDGVRGDAELHARWDHAIEIKKELSL